MDFSCSGQAGHHVIHDAFRIFGARVVGSQYGHIAAARHGLSHKRALGAVAISAAAEHGDNPGEPGVAQSFLCPSQGVRSMGIIHKDADVRPLAAFRRGDPLQTARYAAKFMKTGKIAGLKAHLQPQCNNCGKIGGVVSAYQGSGQEPAFPLPCQPQLHAARRVGKHGTGEARSGPGRRKVEAERHSMGQLLQQTESVRIVGVDRHDLVRARHGCKQFPLGGEIVFHAVMVIKVILRQIGKQCSGKLHPGNAVLIQGVRRDFHDGNVHSCIAHGGKAFMNVQTARSRQRSFFFMAGPAIAHRAQHPGFAPA